MNLKKTIILLSSFFSLTCADNIFPANTHTGNRLNVLRKGSAVYIRSHFSEKEDLLICIVQGQGNKQVNFFFASLIDAETPMTAKELAYNREKVIAHTGDDAPSCHINGTYIAANHGASEGIQVTSAGHGLTSEYLGSEWEDEEGRKFYLIRIVDENKLLLLGRNKSNGVIWKFEYAKRTGSVLKNIPFNKTLNYTEKTLGVQVYPSCRIRKQEYLIDGKIPLREDEAVECNWLDIVEEYDVINAGALLADIISHPGQERNFVAEELDAVLRYNLVYRFFPNGSNTVYHKMTALQEFRLEQMLYFCARRLDMGKKYDTIELYIPKTLPFTQDNINYDFRGIQDYSFRPPSPLMFNPEKGNITSPENPPDRFIQFLGKKDGDKTVREVGFAMGYSVLHGMGMPAKRIRNAGNFLMLYTTQKIYPFVADLKMGGVMPKGTELYCVGYRQYFNPRLARNATCFYWNRQENDTVVYLDYHKSVDKDNVKLPAEMTGGKIEVIEKTPSLTIDTKGLIPAEGIKISVAGNYGYVVFKVLE